MTTISAGLLMFRRTGKYPEIFLVHPGGPFFSKKDEGYWSIPKGMPDINEDLLDAAIREFGEETGIQAEGPYTNLGSVKQKGGKIVHAWAFESKNKTEAVLPSNTFELEWPPRSGIIKNFPEVDLAAYFEISVAMIKINQAQSIFIARLKEHLSLK
jgi:predicted NUDIX family NTP pyrophosphohydrolase